MKRKYSQIKPQRPPIGFHDINRTKCVRFTDIDNDNDNDNDNDQLPESSQKCHAPRYDNPKTSEYAFFKKLKEDAGHRFHSHSLHQHRNQSNKFHSKTECSQERTNIVDNRHQQFRSSSRIKNATLDNYIPLLSPFSNASKKPELDTKIAGMTLEDVHSLQKNMKEYGNILRTGEDHYRHGELFSRKRQKLRQLVAEASFPEIDKLCSKGYDFVSVLLNRLFPQHKEDKCFKVVKTGNLKADNKFNLLTSPESDHQMPTKNLLELGCGPSMNYDSSTCWQEKPRDIELSNSISPAFRCHKTYLNNRIREIDYELRERPAPILCTKDESTFGFHSEKYWNHTLNNFRELDEYHSLDEYLCVREPQAPLLGWDVGNMEDERKLSSTCRNTGLSVSPVLSIPWDDDRKQNPEYRLVSGLCTPSLLSDHPPNAPSLWSYPLASSSNHYFGEQSLEVKNDIVAVLNKFSLPLSPAANHLNVAENSSCDCKVSSIFLSPQNHLWFMSKILHKGHHHPCKEAPFSFGLDFDLGHKFLTENGSLRDHCSSTYALEFPHKEIIPSNYLTKEEYENCQDGLQHPASSQLAEDVVINNFPEDMVNIRGWSSYRSAEEKKTRHLLLDKSNWDGSEEETYSDDNEVGSF